MKLKIDTGKSVNQHFITGLQKLGVIRLQSQRLTSRLVDCMKAIGDRGKKREDSRVMLAKKYGEPTDGGQFTVNGAGMKSFLDELAEIDLEDFTLPIFQKFVLPPNYEKLFPAHVDPFTALEMWALESIVEFPAQKEDEENVVELPEEQKTA